MIKKLAPLFVALGIAGSASVAMADERHPNFVQRDHTNERFDRGQRFERDQRFDRHDRGGSYNNNYGNNNYGNHNYGNNNYGNNGSYNRPYVRTYERQVRPSYVYRQPARYYRGPRFAPPVARVEMVRPRAGYFWVNGRYDWRNDAYVWNPGYYEAQQQNRQFVPGHWEMQDGYYVWVDGYWQDLYAPAGHYEWRAGVNIWIPGA